MSKHRKMKSRTKKFAAVTATTATAAALTAAPPSPRQASHLARHSPDRRPRLLPADRGLVEQLRQHPARAGQHQQCRLRVSGTHSLQHPAVCCRPSALTTTTTTWPRSPGSSARWLMRSATGRTSGRSRTSGRRTTTVLGGPRRASADTGLGHSPGRCWSLRSSEASGRSGSVSGVLDDLGDFRSLDGVDLTTARPILLGLTAKQTTYENGFSWPILGTSGETTFGNTFVNLPSLTVAGLADNILGTLDVGWHCRSPQSSGRCRHSSTLGACCR